MTNENSPISIVDEVLSLYDSNQNGAKNIDLNTPIVMFLNMRVKLISILK